MQWNEVVSILRENARIIVIGAFGVIVLSAAIGFVAGITQRKKVQESSRRTHQVEGKYSGGVEFSEGAGVIPIPDPIIPKSADSSGFMLYNDRYSDILDSTEMDFGKLSDLFGGIDMGLSVDIKPFVFKGEEMDILTDREDIIEP